MSKFECQPPLDARVICFGAALLPFDCFGKSHLVHVTWHQRWM